MYKNGETTPDPNYASLNKIDAPLERKNVSERAQWLGGTGAGAWYEIKSVSEDKIKVARHQANGDNDFTFDFVGPTDQIEFNKTYKFEYGSHGSKVILSQSGKTFEFTKK